MKVLSNLEAAGIHASFIQFNEPIITKHLQCSSSKIEELSHEANLSLNLGTFSFTAQVTELNGHKSAQYSLPR